ncbi:MAG: hypothetical protein FWD94_06395, partial [Treponema sp.]|nr:hypothetical protein [Treponema sp.]
AFSSGDRSGPGAGRDLVTTATLDFDRTEALLEFIGSSGGKAELVSEGGRSVLRLTMLEAGSETVDARLLSMMEEFFTGYNISISLQAPRDVGIRVIPDSPDGAVVEVRGRKAGFSVETSQLPALSEGLELEFTW